MSARLAALLAVPVLVLSGCLAPEAVTPASVVDPASGAALSAIVASTGSGRLVPLPAEIGDVEVRVELLDFDGGEPTIGVTSDGTIFVTGPGTMAARSKDGGHEWDIVGDGSPTRARFNLDPFLFVDPLTDRVFNAPLYVACTHLSWSDDLGETWENNALAGCGLPAHDHQKIAAGPPTDGTTTDGYPNVVYYAYNGGFRSISIDSRVPTPKHGLEGTMVSRSLDGGKTWSLGVEAIPEDCHGGVNAPPHVAASGIVYLGSAECDGINVAISRDSGLTWKVAELGNDVGVNPYIAVNPNVATDAAGNAYVVWPGEDALMYMSVSRDEGATWSSSIRVSPPSVTSTAFSVLASGAEGRVSVAYVATDADTSGWATPQAQDAAEDTRWHLMLSTTLDGLADDPVFTTVRVTPEDDPVQVGCIWLSGGTEECRNLLDFMGLVQHEGRAYLVFTDGCPEGCKDGPEATEFPVVSTVLGKFRPSRTSVAIVERGPSLADPASRIEPLPT
ncbi:MAG TPA: sialidase family protein [Candidatus Thermoplasmatota archaeon]|nr:sialidase family protein [Candidatus Thermoplasmatota archaeon]